MPMRRSSRDQLLTLALPLAALSVLTGCATLQNTSAPTSALTLSGQILGGQQPIGSASIFLYAAGSGGNGIGAYNLLTAPVLTGPDGGFSTTAFTCPSPQTQVYLVSSSGNPGFATPTNNAAIVLASPLGDCGSLPNHVSVNEVTTAAAAYALTQFFGPAASVGSSATNATGLRNAFLVAQNLVNTTTGASPGAALPPGAALQTTKLYTLADALASCVNSSGGSACTPLFSAATVNGIPPTNVLDAALNIVRHPAANVTQVFNAAPAKGPFQPTLASPPNDWTMTLTYTGGGLAYPTGIALDSTGSIWAANYFGFTATKLSATGIPAAPMGFADPALYESYGLTVDPQDNAWITNEESPHAINSGGGTISKFSSTGTLLSGPGYTAGGVYFPFSVAADTDGSVWIADNGHSAATHLASDGTSLAGPSGYISPNLPLPVGVAVDNAHNAWFAAQASAARVTPAGVVTNFPCCHAPSAIAFDPSANLWLTDFSASTLVQLSPSGAILQSLTGAGLYYPQSVALDSAGTAWIANFRGNTISAFRHPRRRHQRRPLASHRPRPRLRPRPALRHRHRRLRQPLDLQLQRQRPRRIRGPGRPHPHPPPGPAHPTLTLLFVIPAGNLLLPLLFVAAVAVVVLLAKPASLYW